MKYLAALASAVLLASCQTDTEKISTDFELVEISEAQADSLVFNAEEAMAHSSLKDTTKLIQATAARGGASAQQWKRLLRNVFSTDAFRKATYLGISNRKGIGTIFDNKLEVERQLDRIVDEQTYKSFLTTANTGVLQAVGSHEFDFNVIFDANALNVDAGLKAQILNADSSRFITGGWQEENLEWGQLKDKARSSNDPKLLEYIKDLNNRKNKVLSKVIRVNGFKSEIFTKNIINSELQAKIDTTIAKLNNVNGSVKFKVLNNKTIQAESSGYFYVYGILSDKKAK